MASLACTETEWTLEDNAYLSWEKPWSWLLYQMQYHYWRLIRPQAHSMWWRLGQQFVLNFNENKKRIINNLHSDGTHKNMHLNFFLRAAQTFPITLRCLDIQQNDTDSLCWQYHADWAGNMRGDKYAAGTTKTVSWQRGNDKWSFRKQHDFLCVQSSGETLSQNRDIATFGFPSHEDGKIVWVLRTADLTYLQPVCEQ